MTDILMPALSPTMEEGVLAKWHVKVGDTVDAETVVCLVEAMKIFNEIKAETSGVVEKILPASGDSVEFGEPMFLIRPS